MRCHATLVSVADGFKWSRSEIAVAFIRTDVSSWIHAPVDFHKPHMSTNSEDQEHQRKAK